MAEVLVVASKIKTFIKNEGGCNTSAETIEVLSQEVEKMLKKAIQSAKDQGRKTVMAKDVGQE
jgi:histone H3/H4